MENEILKGVKAVSEKLGVKEELIYAIRKYVKTRMGQMIDFTENDIEYYVDHKCAKWESDVVRKDNLGIFGLALRKCIVSIEIGKYRDEEKLGYATVNMEYEHVGGGHNGCDAGIRLEWTSLGEICEKVRE